MLKKSYKTFIPACQPSAILYSNVQEGHNRALQFYLHLIQQQFVAYTVFQIKNTVYATKKKKNRHFWVSLRHPTAVMGHNAKPVENHRSTEALLLLQNALYLFFLSPLLLGKKTVLSFSVFEKRTIVPKYLFKAFMKAFNWL